MSSAAPLPSTGDALLRDARSLWREGRWQPLARLALDTLEREGQRASIALAIASAHAALGAEDIAGSWLRRALAWGCPPEQAARALLAVLHDTLGRTALVLGERDHALALLASAPACPLLAAELPPAPQRLMEALASLGLPDEANPPSPGSRQQAASAASHQKARDAGRSQRQLEDLLRNELRNATHQLEAFVSVQSYLTSGLLMPPMHRWAISPDLAQFLLELLASTDHGLVVEFGSGSSTRLIAQTLAMRHARQPSAPVPIQVAFEHLEPFHRQTRALLEQAGLAQAVDLRLAPIVSFETAPGQSQPFYDCDPGLADAALLARERFPMALRVLALVDGPPASTGPSARWPALAALRRHLGGAWLQLVLDDHVRDDEKVVAQRWLEELRASGLTPSFREVPLEKGACVIECQL